MIERRARTRAVGLVELIVVMSILLIVAPLVVRCLGMVLRSKDTAVQHSERLMSEHVLLACIGREVRSARRVLDTLPAWVPPLDATGAATQPAVGSIACPDDVLVLAIPDGSQIVYRTVTTRDRFGRPRPDRLIRRLVLARPEGEVSMTNVTPRVRRVHFGRDRAGALHAEFWFAPLSGNQDVCPYATLVVRPRVAGEGT